jgi:hypothetical protein
MGTWGLRKWLKMVEFSLCMCKALGSIPSIGEKDRKKERKKEKERRRKERRKEGRKEKRKGTNSTYNTDLKK